MWRRDLGRVCFSVESILAAALSGIYGLETCYRGVVQLRSMQQFIVIDQRREIPPRSRVGRLCWMPVLTNGRIVGIS